MLICLRPGRATHPHTVHCDTISVFQVPLSRASSAAVRVVAQNQRAIPIPAQSEHDETMPVRAFAS